MAEATDVKKQQIILLLAEEHRGLGWATVIYSANISKCSDICNCVDPFIPVLSLTRSLTLLVFKYVPIL